MGCGHSSLVLLWLLLRTQHLLSTLNCFLCCCLKLKLLFSLLGPFFLSLFFPVVFLENEIMYGQVFNVTDEVLSPEFVLPIGKAKVEREGWYYCWLVIPPVYMCMCVWWLCLRCAASVWLHAAAGLILRTLNSEFWEDWSTFYRTVTEMVTPSRNTSDVFIISNFQALTSLWSGTPSGWVFVWKPPRS